MRARISADASTTGNLQSSSQLAATFLLGCTRGGSPGIFGVPTCSWPCSPAITQVAWVCHAASYRASTRPFFEPDPTPGSRPVTQA
jgi:hypothetical protein